MYMGRITKLQFLPPPCSRVKLYYHGIIHTKTTAFGLKIEKQQLLMLSVKYLSSETFILMILESYLVTENAIENIFLGRIGDGDRRIPQRMFFFVF